MDAKEIAEGLTGAEARAVSLAFLEAVQRAVGHGRVDDFIREIQSATDLAEKLALGEEVAR